MAYIELAAFDELLEQLCVVDDLVVAPDLRILVQQGVETVWALGDDLLDTHSVEHLDIWLSKHLEQVLVSGTAC